MLSSSSALAVPSRPPTCVSWSSVTDSVGTAVRVGVDVSADVSVGVPVGVSSLPPPQPESVALTPVTPR